jgi:hypothetical protein
VGRHVQAPDEGNDARKDNIEANQELLKRDVDLNDEAREGGNVLAMAFKSVKRFGGVLQTVVS